MIKKILTVLFALTMVGGFLLVLGSASDLDLIDFKTILVRGGIGAVLMYTGFKGLTFTSPSLFY